MNQQEIKIVIKKDGTFTMKVNGIQGESCESLTDLLIQNTGEVEERVYTNDYWDNEMPDYIETIEADE